MVSLTNSVNLENVDNAKNNNICTKRKEWRNIGWSFGNINDAFQRNLYQYSDLECFRGSEFRKKECHFETFGFCKLYFREIARRKDGKPDSFISRWWKQYTKLSLKI